MLVRNPFTAKYTYPGPRQDRLFKATYDHDPSATSCNSCDTSKLVDRPTRTTSSPGVHYSGIASTNRVIKHRETRDRLARELDVVCFEMEAAGLIDSFPYLVIRGIYDYSDSHKSKLWQEYAAATAAAYARSSSPSYLQEKSKRPPIAVPSARWLVFFSFLCTGCMLIPSQTCFSAGKPC